MTKIQQADRDKFMVRFDSFDTRVDIQSAAAVDHISMNSWLLQAVDEKLARGRRIDNLLDAAETALTK
jgi:predicted HicB family RNase H-like nuclease